MQCTYTDVYYYIVRKKYITIHHISWTPIQLTGYFTIEYSVLIVIEARLELT